MKKWILLFAAVLSIASFSACGKKNKTKEEKPAVISITATPEDAIVFIDGKKVGKAPLKGKYAPGSYIVRAEKPGYETAWTSAVVKNGETTEVKLALKPISASVMITTNKNVHAEEVTVNDEPVGGRQTPFVLSGLDFGSHKATLKAPGYSPVVVKWEITDKRPKKVNVALSENTGVLRIDRSVPGAKVKINGKDHGMRFPYEFRTEQGEYEVVVTAPGYTVFSRKIFLKSGKTERVSPVLSLLPGTLVVKSKTEGAFVTVNGKSRGMTPTKIEGLEPNKKVRIVISKRDYEPVSFDMNIVAGKTLHVSRTLESILGSIEFVTCPAGVTVYLDNKLLTVTEKDPNSPGLSKVFRKTGLRQGEHTLKFTHKRAKPTTITQKIRVEKNKNNRIEKPIELWVPNAQIKIISSGYTYTGRIVRQNDNEITFEPTRKSRITYKRSELEITKLSEEE